MRSRVVSSVKQKRCKAIAAELPDGYRVAPWRLGGYAVHVDRITKSWAAILDNADGGGS